MARRYFDEGIEILSGDLSKISAAIEKGLYENVLHQLMKKPSNGFFGNSALITYRNAFGTTALAGNGIQYDNTQTSPETTRRPINISINTDLAHTDPHASLDRIDVISVRSELANELSANRNFKDLMDGTVEEDAAITQKAWTYAFVVTAGTPGGSPSAPATPSGYIKLAEVYVTAVTGIANAAAITDFRPLIPCGSFSVQWYPGPGIAPDTAQENGLLADLFELGAGQALIAAIKVPSDYIAGYPLKLNLSAYSPGTSNNWNLQVVTTLIRGGTDALSDTTNQNTATSGNQTNTVANLLRKVPIFLTDYLGRVNSVAVSPGDILIAKLTRTTITSGSDDTNDVRIVDGGTEGVF